MLAKAVVTVQEWGVREEEPRLSHVYDSETEGLSEQKVEQGFIPC